MDDDELSDADEVFDNDVDDEFSEPDELDLEIRVLVLVDDEVLNGVLFELKSKEIMVLMTLHKPERMILICRQIDLPG